MASDIHILTVLSEQGRPLFTTATHTRADAEQLAKGPLRIAGRTEIQARVWAHDGNPVTEPKGGWREKEGYRL